MSQNHVVAIAVLATASTCLILAGIVFYFFYRYSVARRESERRKYRSSFRREPSVGIGGSHEGLFMQQHYGASGGAGTLRGLLVEENGREVLYLRKADNNGIFTSCFSKVWFNPIIGGEEEKEIDDRGLNPSIPNSPTQEIPLIPNAAHHEVDDPYILEVDKPMESSLQTSVPSNLPPPPPPPSTPPPPPPPPLPPIRNSLKPPAPPKPPPLPPVKRASSKPPVQQSPSRTKPADSSLLPLPQNKSLAGTGFSSSSLKPPASPNRNKQTTTYNIVKTSDFENANDSKDSTQMKLKPLHWDKVPTNAEHSMVWHEIIDGSFRMDDKLMESLFGYHNSQSQKTPDARNMFSSSAFNSSAAAKIFLLDPRKSQNTAIVLKFLSMSRKEILDAIQEGYGLSADALEKLAKISPTPEEAAKILQFDGNPTKLADADSFLYHILKAVPSAFMRINAMLFRSNYDPDILILKESLQTLELACKELRNRGIFFKLLEAILKAGNRMNAGTTRGDAQGFNLSALRKLSSVKSTDGKTTLLHFVVEQLIRSEGTHCANLQKSKHSSSNDRESNNFDQDSEAEKEYIMLGLPVVGGLSTEFSNVKKSAAIDYDNFINMCPTLTMRANDIRQIVLQCGSSSERSGFSREMKGFLEECDEELKVVREEQTRVMQLVKRTTEYYQAGAAKDKGSDPLQLFAIVKDFLDMVDQVCIDISKKLQNKRVSTNTSAGSSPPSSPLPLSPRTPVKFQNLQSYFQTGKQVSSSSESEEDF